MKKLILLLFLLSCVIVGKSQDRRFGALISNNITSMPITTYPQLFYSQFHPGIDLFAGKKINKSEKNQLWVNANLGVFYHRFVQTAIRLYPSINYERVLGNRFKAYLGIGGGYALAFENNDVFQFNSTSGNYETKSVLIGRSQYIGQLELGTSFALKKDNPTGPRLLFQFKTFIQGTFVKGYVPMLPVNSLLLGFSLPIKNK